MRYCGWVVYNSVTCSIVFVIVSTVKLLLLYLHLIWHKSGIAASLLSTNAKHFFCEMLHWFAGKCLMLQKRQLGIRT